MHTRVSMPDINAITLEKARGQDTTEEPYPLGIPLGEFGILRNLGEGGYGKVKLVRSALTCEKLAVKIIPRERRSRNKPIDNGNDDPEKVQRRRKRRNGRETTMDERVVREANLTRYLRHPNIVALLDFRTDPKRFYLFYEYVKGEPLADRVGERGMLEWEAQRYFQQLVDAVEYCHRYCVVHRDIKVENVVIDVNDNVRLIDFGLANYYRIGSQLETSCGSVPYSSPEILMGRPYIGPEVDIWSLGVVLFVMVTGELPFGDPSKRRNLHALLNGIIEREPEHISYDCWDCIKRCLRPDPWKRITSYKLLAHPFVRGPTMKEEPEPHVPNPPPDCWPLPDPYLHLHYPFHSESIIRAAKCLGVAVVTLRQTLERSIVPEDISEIMLPKLKEHDKDDNDAAAADHHYENEEVNTATHESSSIRADIEVKTRSISALTNNTTTTTTTTTSETSLPSTTLPNGLGHRKSRSKFLPWRLPLVGTTNRTGEEPVRHYTASRVIIRCRNSPEVSVYALAEARRHQAECFYKAVSVNSNFNGSSSDAAQASNSQHPLDGQWRSVPSNIAPLLANNNNTSRNHNKQPQQHHAVQNRPSIAAKPIDSSDIIETVATPTSTAASLTRNNGVVPIETIRSGFSHAISAPLDISVHTRSPMNSIQLSGKDPVAIPCSMVKVITSPRVVYRSLQRVERTIELLQQTLTRHRVPHSTSSDGKRVAVAWRPSIDELQHDRLLRKHSCVASLQIWRSASGINAIAMKRIGGSRSRYTCMRSWLSRALRAQQRDKHRNNCCSDMFTGDTGD